jgi:hypothetical protein
MNVRTEKDAQERWCPFASRAPYATDADRPTGLDPQYVEEMTAMFPCIGSRCMAWRWGDPDRANNQSRGYCGLAGKP